MNSIHQYSRITKNRTPWAYLLALALLASCAPAPSSAETTATPIAVAPSATALPPTARPPTPTALPPTPTAPLPTPTAPEVPTASASAQPTAGAAYLVYQRPDGSLWRADGNKQPPISLAGPTEPNALLPWAATPDGKTIAVVLGTGIWGDLRENPTLALWLVGADGSNLHKIQDLLPPRALDLTPGGDDAFNLLPALTLYQELAWSPDGQLITFVSAHQNQIDLYTAAPDGTVTRLTDTPQLEQGPRWSPDGALVAYRTTSGFGTGAGWGEVGLATMPRGGGQPTLVVDTKQLSGINAAVAVPDLFWISPTVLVAGIADSVVGNAQVRAFDVGTRAPTVIFDAPYSALEWNDATRQLAIAGTSAGLLQANPDTRKLAAGLFTWNPDAGPPTQIERAPVEALAWTPQGDALVYSVGGEQPGLRLWAIGAEGDLKTLATQPSKQLRWSLDGQRLATDTAITSRTGQLLGDRSNEPSALLLDWGTQGLFFATTDGSTHDLWLWDDTIPVPQPIDSKLTTTQSARVVLAR